MDNHQYERLYARRARRAQPSAIREICKLVIQPNIKSLAGGWPDPATFPSKEISEIEHDLLANNADEVLQYGTTEGLPELRNALAEFVKNRRSFKVDPDSLLVIHGSQQGMDLLTRVFVEPGDIVLVGRPTYFGATGAITAQGGVLEGVPVDEKGMNIDAMEPILSQLQEQGKKVKAVYVIPNFQNPTGATLTLQRRKRLVELAEKYDFLIFEDDPYGDLRFSGEDISSIAGLDPNGRTFLMHSFSKIFSPGMRLAYIAGEAGAIRKMAIAKQFIDCCTNSLAQYVALEFIKRGYLQDRIKGNIDYYRRKRDHMLELLDCHFPKQVRWNRPEGGFFIWLHLPEDLDASVLLAQAIENKVAFVLGAPFFFDGSVKNAFRLSYSQASEEDMNGAIEILGRLLKNMLDK